MSSLPNPFASTSTSTLTSSPSSASSDSSHPSTTPLFTAGGSAVLTQSPHRRSPGTPVQYHRQVRPASEDKRKQDAAEAEQLRQRVRAAFDRWDVNHDGAISVDDLAAVLSSAQSPVTAEELMNEFVRPVDSNHNGRIDWTEFEAAYLHKLQRDRLQPPDDLLIEMEQDLHRKQHAVGGRMGSGGGGQEEGWKVGDSGGSSGDGNGSSMQQ